MKSYWDYLQAAWLVACVVIAMFIAVTAPLALLIWGIAAGVWPLGVAALLLYIPIGAFAAMVADRLDP